MESVTAYNNDDLVKPTDLLPGHRYRILSAMALQTRFGESILISIIDVRSKIDDETKSMFMPKR